MLSLRPMQAMVLFVLAVLLICPVGSYANTTTNYNWWPSIDDKKVFWKVTTGHHSLDDCNSHSWHRVFVQNHSIEDSLTVTYRYFHEIKNEANQTLDDEFEGTFWLDKMDAELKNPRSGSREGWLWPDVNGWLELGDYVLKSQTKVKFTASGGGGMEFKSTTRETDFTVQ